EDALTITWARRFAPYKRPELLFKDIDKLSEILKNTKRPVQIVVAGHAHRADKEGQELIHHIKKLAEDKRLKGSVVYLPFYNLDVAKILVSGSDIWLSTPQRGKEACGTSSMKACLNGVLQFSTSDGWLEEVDWSDKGWILPDTHTARHLYRILEKEMVPMFYVRNSAGIPSEWVRMMRQVIALVEKYYSAERMINDYIKTLYFPQK
ncbi:MAG: alpha-glucan family phosphorylase, partial [Candidatus Spechtbacterales bacterium]|nr:alpha-glucan family phosphorylase [Candidatus Spechtbacterales bacterium]